MKKLMCRPVSLTDARSGKRIRVSQFHLSSPGGHANRTRAFQPGDALVPLMPPMPILGYWFRQAGALSLVSVYVPGTMPADMRTAAEQGRTKEETWFGGVPSGITEIDLADCRRDFFLQPLEEEVSHAQAA